MGSISRIILRLWGWRLDDRLPEADRYVMIGYPHTSNWDFVLGMLARSALEQREKFILGLMPEGTRSKTERWKSGFYHIAHGANVPIALAYLDYKNKIIGVGKVMEASGNIAADFEIIRDFYKDKTGYHPENQSDIKFIVSENADKG